MTTTKADHYAALIAVTLAAQALHDHDQQGVNVALGGLPTLDVIRAQQILVEVYANEAAAARDLDFHTFTDGVLGRLMELEHDEGEEE